jgi:hypothetical protein
MVNRNTTRADLIAGLTGAKVGSCVVRARRNASFDSTRIVGRGVYENVAALFCVPLRCTAIDCNGKDARTP